MFFLGAGKNGREDEMRLLSSNLKKKMVTKLPNVFL